MRKLTEAGDNPQLDMTVMSLDMEDVKRESIYFCYAIMLSSHSTLRVILISKFKIDILPAPFSGSTGNSNDGRGAAPEVSKALPRHGGQQQAQPPGKRGQGSG